MKESSKTPSSSGFKDVRINIWGEKYGPRPKPVGMMILIIAAIIAIAGVYPVYQIETETEDETVELQNRLEQMNTTIEKLSLPGEQEKEYDAIMAEINKIESVLNNFNTDRGNFVPVIQLIMNTPPTAKSLNSITLGSQIKLTGDAETPGAIFSFARNLEGYDLFETAYISALSSTQESGRVVHTSQMANYGLDTSKIITQTGSSDTPTAGDEMEITGILIDEGNELDDGGHSSEGASESISVGAGIVIPPLKYTIMAGKVEREPTATCTNPPCIMEPPVTILFEGIIESYHPIASYEWDFGDGTVQEFNLGDNGPKKLELSKLHTYTTEGNFQASLSAMDTYGLERSSAQSSDVFTKPKADFTAEWISCDKPMSIRFIDQSSIAGAIGVRSWEWDFNAKDEDTTPDSLEQNPVYTYKQPGEYSVTLTVEGASGKVTVKKTLVASLPPTADFEPAPMDTTDGLTVNFLDTSKSQETGNRIVAWKWDFGDGMSSKEQNPIHKYATKGPYTVRLTSWENDGNCNSVSKIIKVSETQPKGFFNAETVAGASLKVQFSAVSSYSGANYTWDFGDGTTGIGSPISHTYESPGIYTVTLSISVPGKNTTDAKVISAIANVEIFESSKTAFNIQLTPAKQTTKE